MAFCWTASPNLAKCVCVCRWKQSWWISWTAWCQMGKATIITESSSAFCKHQTCLVNLWSDPQNNVGLVESPSNILVCVAWLSQHRTQLFGPYPRWRRTPSQPTLRNILIHIFLFIMLLVFNKILLYFLCSLLEKIEQETWRETGISFVTSVTRLVERLLDYRYTEIKLLCTFL